MHFSLRRIPILFVLMFGMNLAAQGTPGMQRYFLPDADGAIEITPGALQTMGLQFRPDGTGMRLLAKTGSGVEVTLFLERWKDRPMTAAQIRDQEWPASRQDTLTKQYNAESFRRYDADGAAFAEYFIPAYKGQPVQQQSLHAYYVASGLWAEVHLSKVQFKPSDRRDFEQILSAVKVVPGYAPDSRDIWVVASAFYEHQQYEPAAKYFALALQKNDVDGRLGSTLWKVATDNLGMSYGISGHLEEAQRTFEDALKKDPSYPLFYYNLACAFAEKGDLDRALENLQKAYQFKANMIAGEQFPDPASDDSFQRFKNDPRFQKFLAGIH